MTDTSETRVVDGPTGPLALHVSGRLAGQTPVVLVHPINTGAVVWRQVIPLLQRPVVAIDLRGHGSSGRRGPFTVTDGYLLDVLAVLDALGLDTVHLAGGSLGGSISLALAALHPARAHSVTTLGSTLGTGLPDDAIEQMVTDLTAVGSKQYFADLVPQVVGPEFTAAPGLDETARVAGSRPEQTVAAILRAAFSSDIRDLAPRVQAPVLAVAGTADPTCPPAMTEEIAATTGGTVVTLAGVGHLPMVEVPDRVAELINQHTTNGASPR